MSPDRWHDVNRVLDALYDLEDRGEVTDAATRQAALDRLCDDADLRAEVEAVLDAEADAPDFLERDAASIASPLLDAIDAEAADDRALASAPGDRVGPYRLVRELGRGGMSVVYLADRADGQFDQQVALKLLPRAFETRARIARFRAERQILASLDHPGIARLLDGGVTDAGRPYLVMERIDGVPITQYCADHGLGLDDRLALVQQVCAAVEHAHRRLVVHRDLKPANILVTETGGEPQVKLLDFGIAKLLEDAEGEEGWTTPVTRTGEHLMTPEYAAPEQVRGSAISTATDVYQLGVLTYELLAGRRPFTVRGRSLTEIEKVILQTEPDAPSTAASTRDGTGDGAADRSGSGVPPHRIGADLDLIVTTALRKEPDRRYGSAEAFSDDLQRFRDGHPITARPATLGYRVRTFVRRNSGGVFAAAVFALLVVAYAATVTVQNQRVAQERDRAQTEAEVSAAVSEYLVDLFAASTPDQAAGDTLTARQLLERGVDRVSTLSEQPRVQTRLLTVMGRAYHSLGAYAEADSILSIALRERETHFGPDSPEAAKTMRALAVVRDTRGEFSEAESLLTRATAILSEAYGPSPDLAEALSDLGSVQKEQGRYAVAESTYQSSLRMYRSIFPQPQRNIAGTLRSLAILYGEQDRLAEAESLFQETLSIERSLPDVGRLRLARSATSLAVLYMKRDQPERAEPLLREALAIKREHLSPNHPGLGPTTNNLAVALERQGAYAEAEELYRETLDLARAAHGDVHPAVASTLSNVASLHARQDQFAEAERLYREVLELDRQLLPPDHFYLASDYVHIAEMMAAQGRHADAESLLLRGWEIAQVSLPADAPAYDRFRDRVAQFYESWGKDFEF